MIKMNFLTKLLFGFNLILMLSCEDKESASLVNKWKVNSYLKDNNSLTQTAPQSIYIHFNKNKTLSISLEINNCSGVFDVDSEKLSIQNLACTEACCDSEFSSELLNLLTKVNSYSASENQLSLMGDNQLIIRLDIAQ